MIKSLNRVLTSALLCKPFNIRAGINHKSTFSYIRKKELDEIERNYGTSISQKMFRYLKQAKHIYSQGWKACKQDVKAYLAIRRKQKSGNTILTSDEEKLKLRMGQEKSRFKTLLIIQLLPFSGSLLLFYLYNYPASIPSWFSIDVFHQNYQRECIKMQREAIKYFESDPTHLLNEQNPDLSLLTLQQIKILSQLLFGHYEDGVVGFNKITTRIRFDYLFHPSFSRYLLWRDIKKQFKEKHPELKGHPLQQLVKWKYEKVVTGESRLKFQPIQEQQPLQKSDVKIKNVNPSKPRLKGKNSSTSKPHGKVNNANTIKPNK